MFGRGPVRSPHATPPWIIKIARRECPTIRGIDWFPVRKHNPRSHLSGEERGYGCAYVQSRTLELHCTPDDCDHNRLLVLHEIAHLLSPYKSQPPFRNTARKSYHGIDFWETAGHLYTKYGLLDFAIEHESYALGRRYLRIHRPRFLESLNE